MAVKAIEYFCSEHRILPEEYSPAVLRVALQLYETDAIALETAVSLFWESIKELPHLELFSRDLRKATEHAEAVSTTVFDACQEVLQKKLTVDEMYALFYEGRSDIVALRSIFENINNYCEEHNIDDTRTGDLTHLYTVFMALEHVASFVEGIDVCECLVQADLLPVD